MRSPSDDSEYVVQENPNVVFDKRESLESQRQGPPHQLYKDSPRPYQLWTVQADANRQNDPLYNYNTLYIIHYITAIIHCDYIHTG